MSNGSTVTRLLADAPGPPLSRRIEALLSRSDAEVVAARLSQDPAERYLHAHLAALRAGAALVERSSTLRRRGAPRTVWDLVADARPGLAQWAGWFAAAAPRRAAIESGRWETVEDAEADAHVAAAEQFQDLVRAELGAASTFEGEGTPDMNPSGPSEFDGVQGLRAS